MPRKLISVDSVTKILPASVVQNTGLVTESSAPEIIRDTMNQTLKPGQNVVLTPDDAGDTLTITASGGGGGNIPLTNRLITPLHLGAEVPSTAAVSQVVFFYPVVLSRPALVSQMHMYCGTSEEGAFARVGLYNIDPDTLYPTTLIAQAPTVVSGASTGRKAIGMGTSVPVMGMFAMCVWTSNHTVVRWHRFATSYGPGIFGPPLTVDGDGYSTLTQGGLDYSLSLPNDAPLGMNYGQARAASNSIAVRAMVSGVL